MFERKEVTIFAAYAANRLIANYRGIPWKSDPKCRDVVDQDIRRLREKISGSSIILGRLTYEDIVAIESDPITNAWNAQVVVMSRNPGYQAKHEGVVVANSLDDALAKSRRPRISILGGAEVYGAALDQEDLVDLLDLTIIHRFYNKMGGIFFPDFDRENVWQTRNFVKKKGLRGVEYTFTTFQRIPEEERRE